MSNPNHEEELYAQAAAELEDGNRDEGLWAKCFAECDGDENRAKALYLKTRVGRLAEQPPTPKQSTKEEIVGPEEKPVSKPTVDESESSAERLNKEYAEEQKDKHNQTADAPSNEEFKVRENLPRKIERITVGSWPKQREFVYFMIGYLIWTVAIGPSILTAILGLIFSALGCIIERAIRGEKYVSRKDVSTFAKREGKNDALVGCIVLVVIVVIIGVVIRVLNDLNVIDF